MIHISTFFLQNHSLSLCWSLCLHLNHLSNCFPIFVLFYFILCDILKFVLCFCIFTLLYFVFCSNNSFRFFPPLFSPQALPACFSSFCCLFSFPVFFCLFFTFFVITVFSMAYALRFSFSVINDSSGRTPSSASCLYSFLLHSMSWHLSGYRRGVILLEQLERVSAEVRFAIFQVQFEL